MTYGADHIDDSFPRGIASWLLSRPQDWRTYSLARMARREKTRLATEPRYLRFRQRTARKTVELARDELSFVWLAAFAFGVLTQPWIPFHGFSVFNHTDAASSNFIGILWQVQGAALGLSLAVVLFVFQSVHGNRLGGSLRDFAEETWLFPIFYAGLIGLVLDGLVLLHAGQGAPGGWAASWAAIWAGGTAVALGFLFVFTIRAIDPRALQRLRLERTRRAIEAETEDVIFRRVALVALDQFCKENAIEYVPMFGRAAQGAVTVRAKRDGEVRDIRLRRLRCLAQRMALHDAPKPLLRVEIGSFVRAGTELLSLDGRHGSPAKLARSFRIRRSDREQFRSVLEDLHDEGLVAIRTPSPATYSAISELYERVLLVLPETWARYGQEYVEGIAGGANPFELTVQDYLERQLYEEMTQAARSSSRDVAHDALDLPIAVAQRALELKALALTRRMILLWVAARRSMLRDADSEDVRRLLEWSWLRMSGYARRPEMMITENGATAESQDLGKDALLQVWDGYAALCKDILDVRPSDTALLSQINEVWNQPLRYWDPEHANPREWHLQSAIERGEDADVVERIRGELAENQRQIELKREIVDWRAVQRLGLLFWILRSARERGGAERWIPAWQNFAGYFGDVPRLAQILDKGIEADWEDRGRWSNWVLDTLPKREVHGIAVDAEFIQTFVVLALSLMSPDGPPPQIAPLKFGRGRLEDPQAIVRGIIEIKNLKPLLPADRIQERADLLITALEQMQATQKANEEQTIIDAVLDEDLVLTFTEKLRAAWRNSKTLRPAFAAAGTIEPVPDEQDELSGSQVKRWLPKGLFVSEPRVFGLEHIAEEYGRDLAQWEWKALVHAADIADVPEVLRVGSAAQRLRAAVAELRIGGYTPSLVVAPIDWHTSQALELTPAPDRGGDAVSPHWLVAGEGRSSFIGAIEGIPVLDHHHVPDGHLYVFDLARFGKFRERDVADPPGAVKVEITAYDEERIRQLVREDRVPFEEDLDDEAKVRMLQQQVTLNAVYPLEISVVDAAAARHVPLDGAIPED
ncbi:MAG: DUF2254 domain-containing protein [Gaiellaceae bacterium]